jgi:hypothetical protein
MARTRTLLQLRDDVRARGDFEGDGHVTDALLTTWINQGICEWRDLQVFEDPDYFLTSIAVPTTTGTVTYALPATFAEARGVDYVVGTGNAAQHFPVERLNFAERVGPGRFGQWGYWAPCTRWDLRGDNLVFDPDPGTNNYLLHYIPTITNLSADGSTVDGVRGWEDYAVTYALIRALDRQEQDSTFARMDLAMFAARIKKMAGFRDMSSSHRIADVRGRRGTW